MTFDAFLHQLPDADASETSEWLESLDALVATEGTVRARFVIGKLLERARRLQVPVPSLVSTPYINTIPPDEEPWFPGDEEMERRIRRIVRWNAAAMVTRANKRSDGIGGHLSTYASAASLYEVGFNHFFKGKDDGNSGDQIYYQGHAAPGMYSHAFLEGRITEAQLDNFRQETGGNGLSSYPHPRLMPDFWEFPTVSMGIGPLNAIYQARFNRYLYNRHIADTSESRVWCFLGDGECDEPETLGALSLAAREQLDNLTFVVNCNLQRLDGPVRGNGKVIQELEGIFRGAGWNVIKVIWAREWDELLARDVHGVLVDQMNRVPDGEFQKYTTESGAYIREHFFGPDPRLRKMVEHLSDDDLRHLRRGGHDYRKVYSAYKLAQEQRGAPTVILAHTVKGWTLGVGFEGRNSTHQIKKIGEAELRAFRDLLELPISDKRLAEAKPPYYHPGPNSDEVEYLLMRRRALGGMLPRRVVRSKPLELPGDALYTEFVTGSGTRAASTTMVFAGLLRNLLRDPGIGNRIVPIIPDEARTFGMDALFSEVKIYAPFGQRYEPVDAGMVLSYREAVDGQILEEGITEAGSMGSFTAAGTAYATHGQAVIPFYIYYSMFGYQRVGDLIWAFGDSRGRGFMLGGTAGRTTLNGEGLQHEDGHSPLLFSAIPNVRIYDPAFAYELATVIRDGMQRMYVDGEDIFYYITLYNENYPMPPMPDGSEDGILRGLYLYRRPDGERTHRARIVASGTAMQAALEAQAVLLEQHDVAAEVWSATSFQLLRIDALEVERWNRLHPDAEPRVSYVEEQLGGEGGPIVAVTDYMKAVPDQIGRFVPGPFIPLGTDGYGRSDTRVALRRHFEVDAGSIAVAVLDGLAQQDRLPRHVVAAALEQHGIDTEVGDPRTR
ncbi:MAG: pyruvate dehydrogenase (acetyl-transferring), homodimeric type [Candidatus Dormiibacterota bacterium]